MSYDERWAEEFSNLDDDQIDRILVELIKEFWPEYSRLWNCT